MSGYALSAGRDPPITLKGWSLKEGKEGRVVIKWRENMGNLPQVN